MNSNEKILKKKKGKEKRKNRKREEGRKKKKNEIKCNRASRERRNQNF